MGEARFADPEKRAKDSLPNLRPLASLGKHGIVERFKWGTRTIILYVYYLR